MALYPEVQKKGQKAVDQLLGGQRMPNFSDVGKCPYVDAIINVRIMFSTESDVIDAILSFAGGAQVLALDLTCRVQSNDARVFFF